MLMPRAGSAPLAAVKAPAKAGPSRVAALLLPSMIAKARTSFRLSATPGITAIAVGMNNAAQDPLRPAATNRCHSCNWPARPMPSGSAIASKRMAAKQAIKRTRCSRSDNGEPSKRNSSSGMPELSASAPIASLEPVSS
ncbi:hypothetical protein D3C78_1424230 [compost metagenome]